MSTSSWRILIVAAAVLTWGCVVERPPAPQAAAPGAVEPPPVDQAVAVLHATADHDVRGIVRFTRVGDGLRVSARVEGLAPGEHGFHVHQFGDCSASDAASAQGHFAPFGDPHGARDATDRHVGDLGNLTADASGVAEADFIDTHIALQGPALRGTASILGRAVIVHEGRDDLVSQPSGAAGARVACGVVGIAAPTTPETAAPAD